MTTASCEDNTTIRYWSELPDGPLHTILTCLRSFVDFISFSSVCRSWRAFASSLSPSDITSRFPPLLLIYKSQSNISSRRLIDPASPSFSSSLDRICNDDTFTDFPFLITNHGRFLRLGEPQGYQYVILNPFTGEEIYSPLTPKNADFFSHLSFVDSALLLFTTDTVFHWRIGSPSWSCHSPRIQTTGKEIVAIVKGKVYIMDSAGSLFVLDLSPKLYLRQLAIDGIGVGRMGFHRFLVDCGGELLFLNFAPTEKIMGMRFEAFRLDLSANQATWVKKESLGNWAIFVGFVCWSHLMGIAVENPERWGGRSNCVYFATNGNDDRRWVVIKLGEEINALKIQPRLFNGDPMQEVKTSWVYPGF